MFSFTHHFETTFDLPDVAAPRVLDQDVPAPAGARSSGEREWSVALHPYPPNLSSTIDARDLPVRHARQPRRRPRLAAGHVPRTTPTPGRCSSPRSGWPTTARSTPPSATALCQTFRNVLGTPGITSFIYHRLLDHPAEGILKLGLRREDGTPKPAFDLWRHVNDPGAEQCGFELDGHTVVRHGVDPATGAHWYSSRVLPRGYVAQPEAWRLSYDRPPATAMVHECGAARRPGDLPVAGRGLRWRHPDGAGRLDQPHPPPGLDTARRLPRPGRDHGPIGPPLRRRGAARPARVRRAGRHERRADRAGLTGPLTGDAADHRHDRRKAMTAGVTVVSPDAPDRGVDLLVRHR